MNRRRFPPFLRRNSRLFRSIPESEAPVTTPDETPDRADAGASPGALGDAALADQEDDSLHERSLTPEDIEDEAIRGDFVLRWLIVLLATIIACKPIDDSATLLHVKTGELIAVNGGLPPHTGAFSYTAAEREWVNPAWLFDLIAAGIYAAAGPVGLTVLQMLVAAVVFGILVHLGRPGISTWWGSVCAGLALLASHSLLTPTPDLVTLLGLAVVLWILKRWRSDDSPAVVWWLIPLFLLWANLDPRMFVGMALLVAYALGTEVSARADSTSEIPAERRLPLWGAIGGSLAATLVNPFGWKIWAVPAWMYAYEYPTLREYGGPNPANAALSLFDQAMWTPPAYSVVAGTVLLLATLATLVLNRRRLDWGQAAMFAVAVALPVFAVHELAAAALVCAVVAGVNAQEWYAANFRQSYSLATEELIFSRGGRAATIAAFVAVVFLAISGRLEGAPEGLGIGLSQRLAARVDGMGRELADVPADHRLFNLELPQADLLIWHGRKVFLDRRIALYRRGGEDLAATHRQAVAALRQGNTSDGWKAPFDRFDVAAVIVRLGGATPDYLSFLQLGRSQEWSPTQLGATTGVFHRRDGEDSERGKFIESHQVHFRRMAYRQDRPLKTTARLATAPGMYTRKFDSTRKDVPNAIQFGRHCAALLQTDFGDIRITAALAYLAIQHANEGLMEDPNSGLGYRVLGDSYRVLRRIETRIMYPLVPWEQRQLRYFQQIAAYQQSLLVDPEWAEIHALLAEAYSEFNRFDLVQRELQTFERMSSGRAADDPRDREAAERRSRELDRIALVHDRFEAQLDEIGARNAPLADRVEFAYGSGFVLRAIELIEAHPEEIELVVEPAEEARRRGELHFIYSLCLLESGRVAEASESLAALWSFYQAQRQPPPPDVVWAMSILRMVQGAYDEPIEIWQAQASESRRQRMGELLAGLPLAGHPREWPFGQLQRSNVALAVGTYDIARWQLLTAVAQLETGRASDAAATMRQLLADAPDSALWPLVRFYSMELTGEWLEPAPPSDRIPITGDDMFVSDSDSAAKDAAGPARSTPPESAEER